MVTNPFALIDIAKFGFRFLSFTETLPEDVVFRIVRKSEIAGINESEVEKMATWTADRHCEISIISSISSEFRGIGMEVTRNEVGNVHWRRRQELGDHDHCK